MTSREPPQIPEYRLILDVDFNGGRWAGSVEFDGPRTRQNLTLDADGLEIESVREGTRDVPFERDLPGARLILSEIGGARDSIAIRFSGRVQEGQLIGMYRAGRGEAAVLTTQCEPIGARRIFPCLDRPDRKSRIRLTVRARSDLEVISNTPTESTRDAGPVREWSFSATPPMAPYLFYLGVGRFDHQEDRTGRVAVRVLAPPGRGAACTFALAAARQILEAYEEYYRIPYPLPKLDLIAVAEHAFGAMENWGAISFRDMRLLVDASAGSFARRDVFETIAHEIAHQWFGNLVTMVSWDDVWLNESFAALMETRITGRLRPEFDSTTDFYLRAAGAMAALDGDSLPSTHPVRAHVDRPDEISQIFDEISYGKGSTILGMLEAYLGEDRFRAGVTDYLERYRYSNARTEDLWDAFARASQEPIATMIAPWIDRPGHPVVTVRLDGAALVLDQRRFSLLGARVEEPPWPIPLVMDVDGHRQRLLFTTRETRVPVPPSATVHLNPGAVGFYRVLYDRELYDRLLIALPRRSPTDRWSVVEDLSSFLFAGDTDWTNYVRFVRGVGATTDRLVVDSFVGTLTSLAALLPSVTPLQEEARGYLADRLDAIGVERRAEEPPSHGILRERLAFGRVRLDPSFARDLSERFAEWGRLDPDLRAAVAVARARTEGTSGWNEIRRALARPLPEAEAIQLERALAWSSEVSLVERTLDQTLSGEINRGHAVAVIGQAAQNPVARSLVWPWMTRHVEELGGLFRGSGFLSSLLESTTPLLGLGRADELRAFYREHPLAEGSRGLAKGLDRLNVLERLKPRAENFRS
ncbi:MAG TPA: M1 family metallopeptidase [Thermoplasmata archaeon]|nr:M1 family metallopeptidase [Thermoplasmata archaeon]